MEATINGYCFKYVKNLNVIEVYNEFDISRPLAFIRLDGDLSEKDFHFEISDWFIHNSTF